MKKRPDFELDDKKDKRNQHKHCVSFALAQIEFLDVMGSSLLLALTFSE